MECFAEPGFLFNVVLYLLPSLILWFGFSFIIKLAVDWF